MIIDEARKSKTIYNIALMLEAFSHETAVLDVQAQYETR